MKLIYPILLLIFSSEILAASFDCEGKLSDSEKMICSDQELSNYDDYLDQLYESAKIVALDKQALYLEQLEWLRTRDKCTNKDCIKMSYKKEKTLSVPQPIFATPLSEIFIEKESRTYFLFLKKTKKWINLFS